jgi:hypothetical protein
MKKLFKKIAAGLTLLCIMASPASALVYNGVYADSNYAILPGFTITFSQVVGGTNGYSNFVYYATFNSATNSLFLSASNVAWASSNYFQGLWTNILGSQGNGNPNNLLLGGTNNSFGIGGATINNTLLGGQDNALYGGAGGFILGGYTNGINVNTAQIGNGILGGNLNNIVYAQWSEILNGQANTIDGIDVATGDTIVGGTDNYIHAGNNNIILGGISNAVGNAYGYENDSLAAGTEAIANNYNTFVWSDGTTGIFESTSNYQFLVHAAGGVGINTNNPGTNAMLVNGSLDIEGGQLTIGGTNVFTLFSTTATSNGLSAIWNYNLTLTSNSLQSQITTLGNQFIAATNNLQGQITTGSNALQSQITLNSNLDLTDLASVSNDLWTANNTSSNTLQAQITGFTAIKAFTAVLPANYSSIGVAFNTPLMPDGNYSVSLTPQDQNTATAPQNGLSWWVNSKNNSGFTIYIPFATNAYNLNFDCIVKENTQ